MLRSLSLFVTLLAFWLLLSGKYHLEHAADRFLTACGVASCAAVTWLASRRMKIVDDEGHPVQHLLGAPSYALWLFWEITKSNWDVFKRIWNPALPIDPRFVTISYTTKTDFGTVLYANSITLTPGTVTVHIDPEKREMIIHCLTQGVGDDLHAGGMQARVRKYVEGV